MGSGGYDRIAERLFNIPGVDAYLLEYDSERAGTFAPLKYLPAGKRAYLGIVSSKTGELESLDLLAPPARRGGKARAGRTARRLPAMRLCLQRRRQSAVGSRAMGEARARGRSGARAMGHGLIAWPRAGAARRLSEKRLARAVRACAPEAGSPPKRHPRRCGRRVRRARLFQRLDEGHRRPARHAAGQPLSLLSVEGGRARGNVPAQRGRVLRGAARDPRQRRRRHRRWCAKACWRI